MRHQTSQTETHSSNPRKNFPLPTLISTRKQGNYSQRRTIRFGIFDPGIRIRQIYGARAMVRAIDDLYSQSVEKVNKIKPT
jgi:hypothetical protein